MDKYYMEQYKFSSMGKADDKAVIQGETYRFTVLTDSFIRMEYDANGMFEDRPTQIMWNRKVEVPKFTAVVEEQELTISTDRIVVKYTINQPFSRATLMIKQVSTALHGTGVYRYGFEPLDNLGGTYRTLDGIDGDVELDDGLFSKEGYTIINDSDSLVFNDKGWFEKRSDKVVDLYYFGYGDRFKQGLKDFYKVSGKTPMLPRYALGNWWSRYWAYSDEELNALIDGFDKRDIPLSVCIIDMDWHKVHIDEKYGNGWTGYSWNRDLFKEPKTFIDGLHKKGLKTALNLHPALGFRGHEDCYSDFAGFMDVDKEREEVIPFDPIDPKFMKGYFEYGHHPHEDMGVDFWWIDWQQGNNTSMEGVDPLFLLNHYHFMDHGRDVGKRPFIFSRWSGLGGHKYPIGFSGDTLVTWASLRFQPEFSATAANVGYGWWSHDIGGHYNGLEDDELYTRWVQFGVFSPIMRLHTTNNYYTKREPWRHGRVSEQITTDYLRLRHELIPFIYSVNKAHADGEMPLITPMYYDYPKDSAAYWNKEEYMFGSQLLVAPFLKPMDEKLKVSKNSVWFPKGDWFDFFTGDYFKGDRKTLVYGDLSKIPVYAKAGAILPLARPNKKEDGSLKHGTELARTIDIHLFPGENRHFDLYEDDGFTNEYKSGAWFNTGIDTVYEEQSLSVILDFKGDAGIIPRDRSLNLLLRSVKKPINVSLGLRDKNTGEVTNFNGQLKISEVSGIDNVSSEVTKEKAGTMFGKVLQYEICDYEMISQAHNENKEIVVTVLYGECYIDDSYDPIENIMEIVANSSFDTSEKTIVGYHYKEYQTLRGGVIGEEISSKDMISKIVAEDLAVELKEMVIALLSR